jgi:hypothetical protein
MKHLVAQLPDHHRVILRSDSGYLASASLLLERHDIGA